MKIEDILLHLVQKPVCFSFFNLLVLGQCATGTVVISKSAIMHVSLLLYVCIHVCISLFHECVAYHSIISQHNEEMSRVTCRAAIFADSQCVSDMIRVFSGGTLNTSYTYYRLRRMIEEERVKKRSGGSRSREKES